MILAQPLALITDPAVIEATFAADFEAEDCAALIEERRGFLPTSPDDGDEGSNPD